VKRGFTLAEVLVALVVITGGMVALLMVFSAAIGVSRNVEEMETAVGIASAAMEEVRHTPYAALQSSADASDAIFSGLAGYTVTVETTKPANPAQVTVTVSWQAKGGTASIALTTLAAQY